MLRTGSSDRLLEGIQQSRLVQPGDRILVAVSGGPDSTALLVAMHELGMKPAAAHFDHALRSGSENVAAHVGALCLRLGVPFVSGRRESPMPRGSVQA